MSKYGVISTLYFPVFSPNTGKYGPEKTPYLDTFHAVQIPLIRKNVKKKRIVEDLDNFIKRKLSADKKYICGIFTSWKSAILTKVDKKASNVEICKCK